MKAFWVLEIDWQTSSVMVARRIRVKWYHVLYNLMAPDRNALDYYHYQGKAYIRI